MMFRAVILPRQGSGESTFRSDGIAIRTVNVLY